MFHFSLTNAKRNIPFGYTLFMFIMVCGPSLFLYHSTQSAWWGASLAALYIGFFAGPYYSMKTGIPDGAKPPAILLIPKSTPEKEQEMFLQMQLLNVAKAYACGFALVFFGAMVTWYTGNPILGGVIGTAGIFGIREAFKLMRFYMFL